MNYRNPYTNLLSANYGVNQLGGFQMPLLRCVAVIKYDIRFKYSYQVRNKFRLGVILKFEIPMS